MIAHQWQCRLAAVENTIDIDCKAALPVFELACLNIARNADTSVVDEHVKTTEVFARGINRGIPL